MKMPYVDPKDHEKLFAITDQLRRAYLNPKDITAGQYVALLHEACSAITKSVEGGFEQLVCAAANEARDPGYAAEAKGVLSDARAFARFIAFEKTALQHCGVSEAVAGFITNDVIELRKRLDPSDINPDRIMAAVRRCQDDVCTASDMAAETLEEWERRSKVKHIGTITSGISIGLANGAAVAAAAIAAPFAFGVLSVASGGALITLWTQFFNKPAADQKPK